MRTAAHQSRRFLYLYALAASGGAIAYIPFLTILLPLRAGELAGNNALSMLAIAAFAGAISASLANIGFGWSSDVSRTRRAWIAAGLILSSLLMLAMPLAAHATTLIAMIIGWQIGLNMMLAPLAAWAGDCVPDSQKGLLGGLLAFAPALGALSGALVTLPGIAATDGRHMLVVVMVLLLVGPVLVFGRPKPMPHLMQQPPRRDQTDGRFDSAKNMVAGMWSARLLVQIAEASLFAFLLMWFRSIDPALGENITATIFTAVLGVAAFVAIGVGRWSDRVDQPILPLIWCAGFAAAGLVIMSIAPGLTVAIAGYVVFGLASSVFLALHTSQTLRVLPRPHTRGRDLGIFNLTNTLPSLIMPWLILALVPTYGFDALFLLLAGLASLACVLLATIARRI